MKRYRVMASEILGFSEIVSAESKEEAKRIFEALHSKRKLSPDSSEGLEGIETFKLKDWE